MAQQWFTADPHFGADSYDILKREMRPFATPQAYAREQARIWNAQAAPQDTIYVIGDFCNFNSFEFDYPSGLAVSRLIDAHLILITGNNEDRAIARDFGGDFAAFRAHCLREYHFDDVLRSAYATVCGRRFYLTHHPQDHDRQCLTLYGHTHRGGGIWRPYGFNVGVDLGHFQLFGETHIADLLQQKEQYWDTDADIRCFD